MTNAIKIKKLTGKRKWMKATITRIKTMVDDPDTEWTLAKVNAKFTALKEAILTYVENNDAICDLVDDDEELTALIEDMDNENRLAEEIFEKLEEIKSMFIPPENAEVSTSKSPVKHCNHGNVNSVKLPKLDFPAFSGNYRDFYSFVDIFNAVVHNNTSLSNVTRLQYLLSKLTDEPRKLLSNIQVTEENYALAWELLNKRYDNKKVIIFEHLSSLFSLPSVQENSSSGLKNLLDLAIREVRALEVIGFKLADNPFADLMLCYIILKKMDSKTYELWNMNTETKEVPKWEELIKFVEKRFCDLESRDKPGTSKASTNNGNFKGKNSYLVEAGKKNCFLCPNVVHGIYKCPKYVKMTVADKKATVKRFKLCYMCLQAGHHSSICKSAYKCKSCNRNHHSSLHEERTGGASQDTPQLGAHVGDSARRNSMVLLATAIVRVQDSRKKYVNCRVLLDQGSQVNVITEECVKRLGLSRQHSNVTVTGLGENGIRNVKGETLLNLKSMFNNFNVNVNALIMRNVTSFQPSVLVETSWRWKHLQDIPLADPSYYKPGRIDILLGAGNVAAILKSEVRRGQQLAPVAQDTELGWVLFGEVPTAQQSVQRSHHLSVLHLNAGLEVQLKKFWELEEIPVSASTQLSEEEKSCEEFFMSTHYRDDSGRFVVRIPFKDSVNKLGNSRKIAFSRQMQIERKLCKLPLQNLEYGKFMDEYEVLNHMQDVSFSNNSGCNYLPHHYVEKDSTTTKLRVVFDASARTDSGFSFNSIQMTGPNLQGSILDKFIRWRFHIIPIVADVAKMYRQILLHPDDRKYQHILWRSDPAGKMKEYELNTVTYGTASAPYLAMKCLRQLATDEAANFPLGSIVTMEDSYMDDVVTGAPTLEEAAVLQDQLIQLYGKGRFPLRKFMSSKPELLHRIPAELRAIDSDNIFDYDDNYKTLGISWDYRNDKFYFKDLKLEDRKVHTKRTIASDVAKTFDPLGWMAPFFIRHKILLQKLWSMKCDWDEPASKTVVEEWGNLRNEMSMVNNIKINRCVLCPNANNFEIHGFSDASELAYSAVVYIVSTGLDGPRRSSILVAKTKVAPLKHVSIPKLELCGAVLLAKLIESVVAALQTKRVGYQFKYCIRAWTDSSIVLAWLDSPSRRWKTFIANRVAKVQTILPDTSWSYVRSHENPADCASRGLSINELPNFKLWWEGPSWLLEQPVGNDVVPLPDENIVLAEEKKQICLNVTKVESLLDQYSNLSKLIGVTGFIFRFFQNCKKVKGSREDAKYLSFDERKTALDYWIRNVQSYAFGELIEALGQGKCAKSSLNAFLPFLDENRILRVGGRLNKATQLTEMAKHPIILPKNNHLSSLLILDCHIRNLHAGQTLTLASLRQEYWILGARTMINSCIKKCVVCVKYRAANPQPQMGNLPSARISPSSTFQYTGTDFAGPILVRTWSGRGRKSVKAYICIFICFATKAVHLELVSELTTSAFLASLDRFVSIRGKPSVIYSDNGTNYVGAERELRSFIESLQESDVGEHMSKESIGWKFSPPHAPHFGGIWESAVKSAKFHLKRVLGSNSFTVEEMMTVLAKVGACLNSRPLCPMPNQPDDLEVLTPGHFIIGRPLNSIPHPDVTSLKWNSMDRWQKIQHVTQLFWERWSKEYLMELQRRSKWQKDQPNLKVDDIVVLKEDYVLPAKWRLGRVVEAVAGDDGIVRVVKLRTATGDVKRAVVKLCLLPARDETENE